MKNFSKYRFPIYFFLLLSLIFVLVIFSPISLPKNNNQLPANELVTQYYSAEKLETLFTTTDTSYSFEYKYDNLSDLKFKFKLECVRNPQVYNEKYIPYVLLLSDCGKKLFLFYEPESLKILNRLYIDEFLSLSEAEKIANYAVENSLSPSFLFDSFNDFYSGKEFASSYYYHLVEVKEGVFVLSLWSGADLNVREKLFISNEELFNYQEPLLTNGFELWPVLPIDK